MDGFAAQRNAIRAIAEGIGEWAGVPMPLEDQRLVIEPSYPKGDQLVAIGQKPQEPPDPADERAKFRNRFWSWTRRTDIVVWEDDGKIQWGSAHLPNQLDLQLQTLGASDAWGVEQESNAVQALAGMLRHRQFKQYMLTGMFMERSKRSGVHYVFRRLRPTIAFSVATGQCRMLCALCLHPIAYYDGSWAGAMCPTDDVIAHLALMRGDEHMFWRRANQHAPWRREAGV